MYEMTTKSDLVQYLHKCCFSPTTSGWLKAIKMVSSPLGLDLTKTFTQILGYNQMPFTPTIQKCAIHVCPTATDKQ
jgi:hypothetical protein